MIKLSIENQLLHTDYVTKEFLNYALTNVESEEEQKQIIRMIEEKNLQAYKQKLWQMQNLYPKNSKEEKPHSISVGECFQEKTLKEKLDISFYEQLLKTCPNIEELEEYLPSRRNPDFFLIMNLLMSRILREVVALQKFVAEEEMDGSLRKEFWEEIQEKRNLLTRLGAFRDKKDGLDGQTLSNQENMILYLQSPAGNYYALQEVLKEIDVAFYPSFLELIQSIKNGTFKNIKTFVNHDGISGLLEVKNFKTRVVFKRLEKHTYIILTMFIKKVDVDKEYLWHLVNRNEWLQVNLEGIKQSLKNPKYLEEQKTVQTQLERILKREEGLWRR